VSLQGGHYAGRMGASILAAAGLPELVAPSLERYEELAVELASDRERLAALRRRLLATRANALLFNPAKLARQLERAYEAMWALFVAGEAPRTIDIAAAAEAIATVNDSRVPGLTTLDILD
jgi:protein O-GlcNAc transferase